MSVWSSYQTRWHTCAPALRLFSSRCHREGRWESNLRMREGSEIRRESKHVAQVATVPAMNHGAAARRHYSRPLGRG